MACWRATGPARGLRGLLSKGHCAASPSFPRKLGEPRASSGRPHAPADRQTETQDGQRFAQGHLGDRGRVQTPDTQQSTVSARLPDLVRARITAQAEGGEQPSIRSSPFWARGGADVRVDCPEHPTCLCRSSGVPTGQSLLVPSCAFVQVASAPQEPLCSL